MFQYGRIDVAIYYNILYIPLFLQAIRAEGHDPDEYLFDVNFGKGKPGKPVTPSKAPKEAEKQIEKEEDPVVEEAAEIADEPQINNTIEEDELIIKDDIDNDCFEEVDRIGEIEKEVNLHYGDLNQQTQQTLSSLG